MTNVGRETFLYTGLSEPTLDDSSAGRHRVPEALAPSGAVLQFVPFTERLEDRKYSSGISCVPILTKCFVIP